MALFTAGQRVTAALLNSMTPGAWIPLTPQNSWTNHGGGTPPLQYRLASPTVVEIIGEINAGTIAGGTAVGTLPAAFAPTSAQRFPAEISAGTGSGTCFEMTVLGTGAIQLSATITGATVIGFHAYISLDA